MTSERGNRGREFTPVQGMIGHSARRVEDERLVTGSGRYVGDLCDQNTLHCAFVRSTVAHGKIVEFDLGGADEVAGVVGVYTAGDLGLADIPSNTGRGPESPSMTRPPLARHRVRYVGDAVAVVVATAANIAEDAAGLSWVEIDELPPVTRADDALADDVLLFPAAETNVVATTRLEHGDEPETRPAVSVTVVSDSQRLVPTSIEPLAILAEPTEDGIHVWCGHQAPHRLRGQLARFLGMPAEAIRVTAPDVGGAFGMKGMLFPEYLVVTRLASMLGRKVAWIATRRENSFAGTHGRSQRHRVVLEGDVSGRLQRVHIEILADTGAYPHNGSQIPMFSRITAQGLYDIPRVEIETTTVVTNSAPTGSYRGAGRPEAALAIERAIDVFARAAGLDPFDVRFLNFVPPEALPYRAASGAVYDSGDYAAALRRAMDLLDISTVRAEQRRRLQSGADPIGVGVGAFIERAGGAVDSGEYARVEVRSDPPGIVVRTGSTDQGQGHATVWRQVVTEVFGVDVVEILAGDTAEVASGVGTFASRSAQVGASVVLRTSRRVFEEARRRAAHSFEAAEQDIVYHKGTFSVAGSPAPEVSLFSLAAREPLFDDEMFVPGAQTFPYGVHGAVVEVSLETGVVDVRQVVAVDDCGEIINPMIVEGQLHGSLLQGLGQALYEEGAYDADGQFLTPTLVNYIVPRAIDAPPLRFARLTSPAPSNPLGVKGSGEAGCIGLPPAILNATLDALAPYGVENLQLPLRPDRVWQALQQAKEDG
ncbi:MAG: xanthine dehydrogenase family protein molybdopterin-binding subunit [Acidimicrobiia bacterium]